MILPHTPLFSRIGSYLTVLLALLLGAGLGLPSAGHAQNTYTVTNTDDSGSGSLRAAINNANDGSGTPADVIEFDISGSASSSNPHVIQPESELPAIADPLTIDGSTEPDHDGNNAPPVIEIDGTNAGSASGLDVSTGGSLTVRELAIVKFEDIGLSFGDDAGNGNLVQGCYVGVRADGTTPAGNGRGIAMFTRADDTRIGAGFGQRNQRTLDDLNVIAANDFSGLSVIAAATIQGNYIGVDRAGDPAGNGSAGLYGSAGLSLNTSGATVGGGRLLEFNLIAHNSGDGVEVTDLTPPDVGNSIRANLIFANDDLGIDLEGGTEDSDGRTENDAGDADDGQNRFQNFPVIQSASYDAGADEVTVTYQVPSDPDATGDGASAYDLIVDFYEADDDGEEGSNYLYTDTYTTSDYNTTTSGPNAKTITFTPDGDVTSSDKILATATDANGNTSEFTAAAEGFGPNVFTVDVTGDASDTNAGNGTCDDGTGSCTLRAALEETNALANASAGPDEIRFDISGSASPSSPHVIQPDSELPDITDPVVIDGTTEPDHNSGGVNNPKPVLEIDGSGAGNNVYALYVDGGGGLTARALALVNFERDGFGLTDDTGGNVIQGCHVGVRADGVSAAGNNRGFFVATQAPNTLIGGPQTGEGNIISGNSGEGIDLARAATIQGNRIGVDVNGDPLGNGEVGQSGIETNGSGAIIGGTGAGEGNVIAHSDGDGVRVANITSPNPKNSIRGNRIFANGDLGIDLEGGTEDADGRTENDDGDADDGQNRFQNFPEIQSADYDASANEVTVTYQVPSNPNETGDGASTYPLAVDVYKAGVDDEEGRAYLGTDTYTTSDYNTSTSGPESKTATITPPGDVSLSRSDDVVATATDANGNTSEFSAQAQQLPVELASFEAAQSGEAAVELSWTTASETNNAGFRVQHRVSKNEGWTKVGSVESKASGGTTTEAQTYRVSAEELAVGVHEFRLRQVDLDGTTTSHGPVSVELKMEEALRLDAPVPNPAGERATVSFAVQEQTEATVAVYNTLGQKVRTLYRGTPTAGERQTVRLETEDLASGTYLLRLRANGRSQTERLTVVR
jgi:hypothetical protein